MDQKTEHHDLEAWFLFASSIFPCSGSLNYPWLSFWITGSYLSKKVPMASRAVTLCVIWGGRGGRRRKKSRRRKALMQKNVPHLAHREKNKSYSLKQFVTMHVVASMLVVDCWDQLSPSWTKGKPKTSIVDLIVWCNLAGFGTCMGHEATATNNYIHIFGTPLPMCESWRLGTHKEANHPLNCILPDPDTVPGRPWKRWLHTGSGICFGCVQEQRSVCNV